MDHLTYTLRGLCQRNRDGSHATQADRLRTLTLASRQLREGGFRQMRASSLKGKHIEALIARWQTEELSAGTLKNRVAHLRWWAEKIGRAGLIPGDNAQLAIPDRQFVTNEDKARRLGDGDVHAYFNHYKSPYDAFINYMNVLTDFREWVLQPARPDLVAV